MAQAPFKNLLMMGFMMWMAGSTVHLFSIGITFSALWQPLSALQGVGKGKLRDYLSITFIVLPFRYVFEFDNTGLLLSMGLGWGVVHVGILENLRLPVEALVPHD